MNLSFLYKLLETARPHKGDGEREVGEYLKQYDPTIITNPAGSVMAYYVPVGDSKTLFVAHMDTAEAMDGKHVLVNYVERGVSKVSSDGNSIIGADDGAGVWLLTEMIEAGVPGGYFFTVGEERGGVGAKFLSHHYGDLLGGFDCAIAFDRRGYESVITHQAGGRCCSDAFAEDLATRLNDSMESSFYLPDDTGIYTDTAEFTGYINNCTNVSCGYFNEHSHKESLDLDFLIALRGACINVDWETLDNSVRPDDPVEFGFGFEFGGRYSSRNSRRREMISISDLYEMEFDDINEMVYRENSEDVAELIWELLWGKSVTPLDEDKGQLEVGMW